MPFTSILGFAMPHLSISQQYGLCLQSTEWHVHSIRHLGSHTASVSLFNGSTTREAAVMSDKPKRREQAVGVAYEGGRIVLFHWSGVARLMPDSPCLLRR